MRKIYFSLLVVFCLSWFLIITAATGQEGKGLKLKLGKGSQVQIKGLSKSGTDCCWLEYAGASTQLESATIVLHHKREGFDDHALEVQRLAGKVDQVLGGTWRRRLLKKGQVLSVTKYDAYGKPVETTREPIETVLITVRFRVIDFSNSQATVLVLPDSKIVSTKE